MNDEVLMRDNMMDYRRSWDPSDAFDWQLIQQRIIDGRDLLIRFKANDQASEEPGAREANACIKQDHMCRYYMIDADRESDTGKWIDKSLRGIWVKE